MIQQLRAMLRRQPEPPTHDLTRDDYAFTPRNGGMTGFVACWSAGWLGKTKPNPGDYLILRNGDRSSRYQVRSVDRCLNVDPSTMWTAQIEFAPRLTAAHPADERCT